MISQFICETQDPVLLAESQAEFIENCLKEKSEMLNCVKEKRESTIPTPTKNPAKFAGSLYTKPEAAGF